MNVDPSEIAKFDQMAADWWDKSGPMKPLHDLNPLRVEYISKHADLANQKVLDLGCGAGILSEALAKAGANVTAIDMSNDAIEAAKLHAKATQLNIDYQHTTVEQLAASHPGAFDVITCMEMLEHVPDPKKILQACQTLLKPYGKLFLSTLNRNIKSYLGAIIGAEYILRLLPRGTHDYAKFIKPSELARWANSAGFDLKNLQGIDYHVLKGTFSYAKRPDINYLAYFIRR